MSEVVPNDGPVMQTPCTEALRLARMTWKPGHAFGFAQPVFQALVDMDPAVDPDGLATRLEAIIRPYLLVLANPTDLAAEQPSGKDPPARLLETVARTVAGLQEVAGIPVAAGIRVLASPTSETPRPSGADQWYLAMPTMRPQAAADALTWVVWLSNALWNAPGCDSLSAEQHDGLDRLMQKLGRLAPGGTNNRHLLRAALALRIPCLSLPLGTFQFGWGKYARLFRSSETDATSNIAVAFAKHKLAAAAMLRMAGLPVPDHEQAATLAAALDAARRIGFPVVVKPSDRDMGDGATAGLLTESDVAQAYEKARSVSPNVMVEKHVDGGEYRLLVVHGRLFSAHERVPARLTGDGKSTIRQLIDHANRGRRTGRHTGLSLMAISITEESLDMLKRQGHTLDSVPSAGQVVQLQRVPNITGGGDVRAVLDVIHPDNIEIAERAARLLRLDITGIDFLTPDIARSWRDVGGKITEVNGQPQVSPLIRPQMYERLLREFVRGDGRIPVVLVVDDDENGELSRTTRVQLETSGIHAGVASQREIAIGAEVIIHEATDPYFAAKLLMTDPTVEAMVLFADGRTLMRHGLPFDRIDLLAFFGAAAIADQFLGLATPHIEGDIFLPQDISTVGAIPSIAGKRKIRFVKSPSDLPAHLCELILARAGTM